MRIRLAGRTGTGALGETFGCTFLRLIEEKPD